MCMGRRNLKHRRTAEIWEDILYLITKRPWVVFAAFKRLVRRGTLVLLLLISRRAHVALRLVAFYVLTLNIPSRVCALDLEVM